MLSATITRSLEEFSAVRLAVRQADNNFSTVWKIGRGEFTAKSSPERAVELIARQIAELPDGSEWIVTIPAMVRGGFSIDVSRRDDRIVGQFGNLTQDFGTAGTALFWVARALSTKFKLRTHYVGGKPVEWYLEPSEGTLHTADQVLAAGKTILFSRFRANRDEIHQNAIQWGRASEAQKYIAAHESVTSARQTAPSGANEANHRTPRSAQSSRSARDVT